MKKFWKVFETTIYLDICKHQNPYKSAWYLILSVIMNTEAKLLFANTSQNTKKSEHSATSQIQFAT